MTITASVRGLHAGALRRDGVRERWMLFGLSLPALLLVGIVLIIPVSWLFWLSFLSDAGGLSLEHYHHLADHPAYARIFRTTFEVSFMTTALCVLLGYPLAYLLAQLPRRLAAFGLITVLLPFWTSVLVRTYAWLVLLQGQGLVNHWGMQLGLWSEPLPLVHNFSGTLIGMTHIMLPYLILPLYGSMRAIDEAYVKAAANLGASPVRAFWSVYLPLSLPGLAAGATIVFILCLGFYVTPALLGGGKVILVSMRIASDIELFFNWGAASALGVVLLVLTVAFLFLASRLVGFDRVIGGSPR
jgi:putative spermidine/putrescine transport system permease protein/spermidine/putrescine transport system permease protein